MPLFSRKSTSSSSRKASGSSDAPTTASNAGSSGGVSNSSSQDSHTPSRLRKLTRSASGASTRSNGSDVKASDLLGSFTKVKETPASRRMPSHASTSLESSVSDLAGQHDTSIPTSSRSGISSTSKSIPSASVISSSVGAPASISATTLPSTSSNSAMADLRHRGYVDDSLIESSSDDDDENYDSPEEFVDAPDTLSPTSASTPPDSSAPAVSQIGPSLTSFTPEDATKLAVPVNKDTAIQADLRQIWYAISLFLNSQFAPAEAICATHKDDRLYYALGSATLTSIKAMMSFEPTELAAAVEECKKCLNIADRERNNWAQAGGRGLSWSEKIAGGYSSITRGSSLTVETVQRMTVTQRHAELAYAECLLIKAMASLMYAGDFIAFIKESLNMRTSHAIYKVLRRFIEITDAAHPSKHDPSLDLDFRSGVDFGIGCSSLVLSLLPSTAIKIVELFGFSGNREEALDILMRTGGWTKGGQAPILGEGPGKEGLRRPVCDLILLTYHLIISSVIPVQDVDINLAERILQYNLARYPDGVFFLYFSGRLFSAQTLAARAIEQYYKALQIQSNAGASFKQIQHIVRWDLSLTYLSLGDYIHANESLSILAKESNWSKAVYSYGQAVTMYEVLQRETVNTAEEEAEVAIRKMQLREIMKTIPGFVQRIAGKSLPIEKYVARKSKKFLTQHDSLALPGLEIAYMFSCLSLATRQAILTVHLPEVNAYLAGLEGVRERIPSSLPVGWWDDYCLAHFLRGVLLQYLYRPDPQVKAEPFDPPMTPEEADKSMIDSLNVGVIHSTNLELDHYVAYLCHVELARLMVKLGPDHFDDARNHINTILEAKIPFGPSKGKGKVSMQNAFVMKANGILEQLNAQTKH